MCKCFYCRLKAGVKLLWFGFLCYFWNDFNEFLKSIHRFAFRQHVKATAVIEELKEYYS